MKKIITIMLFTGLLSSVTASQAELTANVAVTSNYVWRGVSQSAGDPALQAGLDYSHSSGLYAGAWGSNVDWWEPIDGGTDNGEDIEIDIYAGYSAVTKVSLIGEVAYDIGFIRYIYPGTNTTDSDFSEVYMGLTLFDLLNLKYSYSNDFGNIRDEAGNYLEGGLDIDLPKGFVLTLHAGRSWGEVYTLEGNDYVDHSVGIQKEYAGFVFDVTHHNTDVITPNQDRAGALQNNSMVVFTVSKDFGIF
jgi:uncharacterized protein (TIGR02001 family)